MSLVRVRRASLGNVPAGAGLTFGPWFIAKRWCGAYLLLQTARIRVGLRLMAFTTKSDLVVVLSSTGRWLDGGNEGKG